MSVCAFIAVVCRYSPPTWHCSSVSNGHLIMAAHVELASHIAGVVVIAAAARGVIAHTRSCTYVDVRITSVCNRSIGHHKGV
eukprot:20199-Eustigmatos_ZCMA.PRE.1